MHPTTTSNPTPLASTLVARFLRLNNYNQTLQTFIREAGLPADVGWVPTTATTTITTGNTNPTVQDPDEFPWTIEGVLEEKRSFDYSLRFERVGEVDARERGVWRVPEPSKPNIIPISSPSNYLAVSVEPWKGVLEDPKPSSSISSSPGSSASGSSLPYCLVVTGADRRIHFRQTTTITATVGTDVDSDRDGRGVTNVSLFGLSDSPILSYVSVYGGEYAFITNMSGQILLIRGSEVLDQRRDHGKYVVKVVATIHHERERERKQKQEEGRLSSPSSSSSSSATAMGTAEVKRDLWIATAGWDGRVFVYRPLLEPGSSRDSPRSTGTDTSDIGDPVACINLPTNPESMLFITHPDSGRLILLLSRRDSTNLHYYQVEPEPSPSPSPSPQTNQQQPAALTKVPYECKLLGKQNLAPHSIAWVTFSPSCLSLSPHDPGLIAVATSTTPHMKVLIVRLLFPLDNQNQNQITRLGNGSGNVNQGDQHQTQVSQALADLSLQNREDAAILIQTNTFAPQTAYSTPQVVWRPDGSGLWVNGDDGVIRGVETKTGKVVVELKDGHRIGSKIRTIWAGWVDVDVDVSVPRDREGGHGHDHDDGEPKTTIVKEEWLVTGGFDKRLIVWRVC